MSRYHRNTKREGEKSTRRRDDRLESLDRITAPTEGCSKREQRNANGRISSVAFRVLKARLYRSTLSSLCLFSLSLSLPSPSLFLSHFGSRNGRRGGAAVGKEAESGLVVEENAQILIDCEERQKRRSRRTENCKEQQGKIKVIWTI